MPDAEKQEGQKTVVAFITGLLIGGLLVWVFSSTPDAAPQTENEDVTTEESVTLTTNNSDTTSVASDKTAPAYTGTGSITVSNQTAGNVVKLGATTYPSDSGWIVVRDYTNGVLGNILGAARYNKEEGLSPTSVDLLRNTVKGTTYQVVFYTESGDKKFGTTDDKIVEGSGSTFKAE